MHRSFLAPWLAAHLLALPMAAGAIDADAARHLLVRTGFAATPADVARLEHLSHGDAVDLLLRETRTEAVTLPPWAEDDPLPADGADDAARGAELEGWWVREMVATPSPLTERMTLFWHNHFAFALHRVGAPSARYRLNRLLRRQSLGSFRTLLQGIAGDPALTDDGHFVRALLRFTAGDRDPAPEEVEAVARALARAREKGGPARLARNAAIDARLRDPHSAEFVVAKLWREFISARPDREEVRRLAAGFRRNYQIKPLLRSLLLTRAFRAPEQRGCLIKSPVELLVGTARQFGVSVGDGKAIARVSTLLGQDLFAPPAEGWKRGTEWISARSLLARQQAVDRLLRGREEHEGQREQTGFEGENPRRLHALLLPIPAVDPIPAGLSTPGLAVQLAHDLAYQLK